MSKGNGWTDEEAVTALILGLRYQSLTVLNTMAGEVTLERLKDALELRYCDSQLEHLFNIRAQLKDRVQLSSDSLH